MQTWRECKLGDVINLKRGYDLPRQDRMLGSVPIVSSSGVTDYHAEAKVKGPGVVTGRYGTLGEVFYIEKDFWPLNTSLYVQDFKGNHPRFVSYFLRQLNFGTQNAAGAVPGVNRNHLHAMKVLVPPLRIQRRIAGILSAYDELIEKNQRRIKIMEEMARSLYREWFVNFRFPGHEKVPLVDSPLGRIPKGWDIKSLAELMEIRGGSQPPKSEFMYEEHDGYIRLIQIRDYEADTHLTFVRDSSKLRKCERTDIMIARYGASVARICSGLKGAYNVALAKVFPLTTHYQEFLRQFLSDEQFQSLLIGMSGRAAQNGFNKGDIAAIRVPFPVDAKLPKLFDEFAVPLLYATLVLRDKNQVLEHTRDLLLPRLLSGDLALAPANDGFAAASI